MATMTTLYLNREAYQDVPVGVFPMGVFPIGVYVVSGPTLAAVEAWTPADGWRGKDDTLRIYVDEWTPDIIDRLKDGDIDACWLADRMRSDLAGVDLILHCIGRTMPNHQMRYMLITMYIVVGQRMMEWLNTYLSIFLFDNERKEIKAPNQSFFESSSTHLEAALALIKVHYRYHDRRDTPASAYSAVASDADLRQESFSVS